MADITLVKISALPAAEQIGAEDLLPVVQEGTTKAAPYGVIKDDIANELAPDATLSEAGKAADAKAVGDALALKADKAELTAEVNRIDAALNTKVNNSTYTAEVERIDGDIATKADAAATTAALATKANANDVTAALALKADTATVNASLATKANTSTVNAALALKADKTELTAGLATKQDVLTFDSTPTEGSINPVTSGGVWEDVSEIKDEFDAAIIKTQSANLLNPENITVGKFYKTQVGEDGRSHMVMGDNAAFSCAYVDIITGESYISTGINYNAYTGDNEGYATGIAANASSSLAEPIFNTTTRNSQYNNNDKAITRLYISWRHATYPTDTYMIVNGTTLPGEYVPYESSTHLAEDIKVDYSQIENVPASDGEIYTVDPSGAGDYTTFTACIKALRDNTNNKTIYVKAGTYDIFEEIGGQAYCESISGQGMTWMEANDLIPPHTKIIGIGEVIFEFLPEASEIPSDVATLLSPLNITHDIYMENITVIADNCRYGIHDDTLANGDTETRHIYKNVRINHGYSNAMGMKPAFGCGTNRGQYMEFDSCIFESTDRAFSFHNRGTGGAVDNTLIVVKNCAAIADANQRAFWFGNVNGFQALVDVRIMSSYIDGKIVAGNESTGTERPNAFKLTLVGCGNPTIEINNATNIYTPTVLEIA